MGKFEIESMPTVQKSIGAQVHYASLKDYPPNIPVGMEVLGNQVAGHDNVIGMLKKDGLAYKPLVKKQCGQREIEAYEKLGSSMDRMLIEMRHLVPKYHGVQKLQIDGKQIDFLLLEDLTNSFKEPCIMDVKIGRRTWDPFANYNKIISEESKYHRCKRDLGFCIPGFQVYKLGENKPIKYGKEFGKKLDKEGARDAIKTFLNGDAHHFCRKLLVQFLAALWQIQHFARNQRRLRLYSSSILLVYDARRLREHVEVKELKSSRPLLNRQRSLYRPLSLAQLNNQQPTGFSGQLTIDGPILRSPCKKAVNLEAAAPSIRHHPNTNTWRKSMHALKRTHSFQNDYDKDVQNRKDDYAFMLDDLCCESKCEVWATAKMIDFAHTYDADSIDIDRNYLDGVDSLIRIFEDFLAETEE